MTRLELAQGFCASAEPAAPCPWTANARLALSFPSEFPMYQAFLSLARRLERAQALQNERFNQAAGGQSLPVGGGFAHFRGEAHPLNQALGLIEPVSESDLSAVEAFLGSPTVLELCPGADPSLWPLLAKRGYRLHQFQQLWVRSLAPIDGASPSPQVRMAEPREADLYNRVVCAGFMKRDDWRGLEPPFRVSLEVPDAWGFLAFVEDQPAGGGMLGLVEGVALLSGDGVLPRFRGRGLQKALILARLAFAQERGCDVACAGTAPGTASQRSYESCGFHAAYPKVEMARG
jgi:GNAT superfamily N-acetyltransferase